MCDFHSIVVRRDGAKAHVMSNSHSGAVQAAGWRENDQMADLRGAFFVEVEWHGQGKFPGVVRIIRNPVNVKQGEVIEQHYTSLAHLLADPRANAESMLFGQGLFAGEEYADVRWKVFIDDRCPKRVFTKLLKESLFADDSEITSLHPGARIVGGSIRIAAGYKIDAPALTKTGYVRVEQGASLTAPARSRPRAATFPSDTL